MKKGIFIEVFTVVISSMLLNSAGETCQEVQQNIRTLNPHEIDVLNVGSYADNVLWYNVSFWGGHGQIPSKSDLDDECFRNWDISVVLQDTHPDIADIGNDVINLAACSLNRNRVCESNMNVEVRKCQGHLLYRFPRNNPGNVGIRDQYICFDRIYAGALSINSFIKLFDDDTSLYMIVDNSIAAAETLNAELKKISEYTNNWLVDFNTGKTEYLLISRCSDTTLLNSNGYIDQDILHAVDVQTGWYNAFQNGTQYVFPSFEDIQSVYGPCQLHFWKMFFLQDPVPRTLPETPVRLVICELFVDHTDYDEVEEDWNCLLHVYARSCNGRVQFDLSNLYHWWPGDLCLIYRNNVFVKPEIRHGIAYVEIDGKNTKEYTPFLQYTCSFDMEAGVLYQTNWYINGTLMKESNSSSQLDDLAFREEYLNTLPSGYEVQCGVVVMSGNQSDESLSDIFYAGWKVPDRYFALSKSGSAFVTIEQTIPLGCYYTDSDMPQCYEKLSLVDPSYNPDSCAGTVRAQDKENPSNLNIAVKSVKKGEEWTSKKYTVKLSTIDNDYDDKTKFDLEVSITRKNGHGNQIATATEIVGTVRVYITDINNHWNKRCYSHVDPHHKTSDGQHFEMQREGDYIMYKNEAYQSEIQLSARYCEPGWTSGPICACGIAIRVGADAFVFDVCPERSLMFDYFRKEKENKIDIEKRDDNHYKVRTPIGTLVDIYRWGQTMNIDIYMAAKDFDNVIGLCGYFDGYRSNVLRHRDGVTVSYDSNRNHEFSNSWKLTDEENLFTNRNINLEPWKDDNAGGSGQTCSRPNSITKKKIEATRRKKRSLTNRHGNRSEKQYQSLFSVSRTKRSVWNLTGGEAFKECNKSIYLAPAVQEFPDKLGEEDLEKVVEQCVYDLTEGNDTQWLDAHISALNNAADAILKLNPVFVASNSDMVKSYLTKICLNNCSKNGVCTESGNCECNGVYRGPDCSIDIRIPPIVYEVLGGDICDTDNSDDCNCHQIRTDNIFDGFFCQMIKNKVYFNGDSVTEGNSTFEGDYHDIFTGVCCYSDDRRKGFSDENDNTITMYELSVSNNGNNYGEPNTVYTYNTTCIEQEEINGTITFEIKPGFCYINGACVIHNDTVLSTDECYLCDPSLDPYHWTTGYCEETDSTGFGTVALVGIIIGSSVVVVVVTGAWIYLFCRKGLKKHSLPNAKTNPKE